ncbi:thiamine pyrophosphate-binding protein [Alphaproteobacteria bacterium]|nr:thiamine pyrophosphate-binding protein [Alphaproteobacteria bacterium]MDC1120925.1 thiamine pyrophosphate-binding protein [Alphaproteobacteria bacterium]
MTQQQATGGSLLMDCLIGLGAYKGFGVPGESYLAVLDAMYDRADKFELILCRHESGAAYMAEAWGKLTGTPGICFVTRGPGATNASIGIHTAMQNSSPMLLFVGQVGTDMRGREAFQEIDYTHYFGKVAKWVCEIDDADRIPELIARAWTTALSGRPGPVIVALPENMLRAASARPPCGPVKVPEPALSSAQITQLQDYLRAAQRPVVLYGGSGWTVTAARQLETFAAANDVPLVAAFRYHDICDNHHPCFVGDAGVGVLGYIKTLLRDADMIVALNIRFGEMTTDGYDLFDLPKMAATLIHSNVSDAELGKIYIADLPLQAGPNAMAQALAGISLEQNADRKAWCGAAKAAYDDSFTVAAQPGALDMRAVLAHLRDVLPDNAIVTNGAGNFATWPSKFIKYDKDMRLLAPQSGAMGYGLPAALAAKAHDADRFVLCFAGDGDFQMNCAELGTGMQAGLYPIVLIVNNGSYGTIRMHQERNYPHRVSGTDLQNPDFAGLARSYGFYGETVETTDQFAAAFERAMQSKTGAVLNLVVATEAITPRLSIDDLRNAGA